MALFASKERERNFRDKMIDSGENMHEKFESARKKIDAVHEEMGRSVLKMFWNGERRPGSLTRGKEKTWTSIAPGWDSKEELIL